MRSFEKRFPESERWVRYKLTLYKDHNVTEEQLKRLILGERNEDDYEIGYLKVGKTIGRLIMRKKQQS